MAEEKHDGLHGLFGSALVAFDLTSKAEQIKCNYTLKSKINSLLSFIEGSKVSFANP